LIIFFFHLTSTPKTYTLSLHDALPIFRRVHHKKQHRVPGGVPMNETRLQAERARDAFLRLSTTVDRTAVLREAAEALRKNASLRSEEHTSELQSRFDLVCRLLLEKKKE